jgi:site-specific DNA recombinase
VIAAIYAHKSTEQRVADEAKSVTRQVENAKAFATKNGWTVADAHIYIDDDISGAEFERRPSFMRMMGTLPRPPFQVLIVSEQKSLGRESWETGYVIKQLALARVEVFSYMDGKSLTPKNWLEKAMASIRGAADEAAVADSSARTHEAHTKGFKAGHVVGGRVFGYRNEDVCNGTDVHGRPLRSHVVRVINPVEAAVVVRIFELYDSGYGLKRITKILRSEGAVFAEPFKRKTGLQPVGGWSPSTVRAILCREMYRGVGWWNRTRKKNDWFMLAPTDRPESEWVEYVDESLRIVTEELWKRVESRRNATEGKTLRFSDGRMSGRPPKHAPQNLLAGLATCGVCGGGIIVDSGGKKTRDIADRIPKYICHRRRAYGTCENMLRIPVSEMNEAVLQAIEAHALTPEAVEQVILLTERDDAREQQDSLHRERKDIAKRIERLVIAVETAGDVAALATKLRELEARRTSIDEQLTNLRPLPRLAPAVLEDRLGEWRRLLRQSVTQSRAP